MTISLHQVPRGGKRCSICCLLALSLSPPPSRPRVERATDDTSKVDEWLFVSCQADWHWWELKSSNFWQNTHSPSLLYMDNNLEQFLRGSCRFIFILASESHVGEQILWALTSTNYCSNLYDSGNFFWGTVVVPIVAAEYGIRMVCSYNQLVYMMPIRLWECCWTIYTWGLIYV